MSDRYILEALQKAVMAAVAASTSPTLPVNYLGRTFEKPEDGKWLEIVFVPNNIEDEFWDTSRTYQGILRLLLHWPANDQGVYDPMDLAASISSYFTKGRKLNDKTPNPNVAVKITNNANLLDVVPMGDPVPEILFPISIRYEFFKA